MPPAFCVPPLSAKVPALKVTVTGPAGDFWLRDHDAPVVMVAGGSGLAPILAMLQAAVDAGDARDVVLLFGARTQRDLYALDEIHAIAERWKFPGDVDASVVLPQLEQRGPRPIGKCRRRQNDGEEEASHSSPSTMTS